MPQQREASLLIKIANLQEENQTKRFTKFYLTDDETQMLVKVVGSPLILSLIKSLLIN